MTGFTLERLIDWNVNLTLQVTAICKLGVLISLLMSDSSSSTPKTVYYHFIAHLYDFGPFGSISGTPSESSRGSWKLRLIFQGRAFPPLLSLKPARNSNSLKSYVWPKQDLQKPTNPTVAREWGTVASRDQKCREALVDLYNILEYQKDRWKDCIENQLSLLLHYGRGCKIRISRRTRGLGVGFQAT